MSTIFLPAPMFEAIMRAAYALEQCDRRAFLHGVAERLQREPELDEGLLYRIVRDIQYGFPHPTPPKIESGWECKSQRPRKLVDAPPLGSEYDARAERHRRASPHIFRAV